MAILCAYKLWTTCLEQFRRGNLSCSFQFCLNRRSLLTVPQGVAELDDLVLGLVLATEKFWSLRNSVLPEVAKTVWRQLCVANGMLNILVPQIMLNRARVMPIVD